MNESEILNAAIIQSTKGNNPFIGFTDQFQFTTPEPYLDLIRITSEYVNPMIYPLITGEQRKKWLNDRLEKFKLKYLETI